MDMFITFAVVDLSNNLNSDLLAFLDIVDPVIEFGSELGADYFIKNLLCH